MGNSPRKTREENLDVQQINRSDSESTDVGRLNEYDTESIESFVFVERETKERSCSVSSAEEAVSWIERERDDSPNQLKKVNYHDKEIQEDNKQNGISTEGQESQQKDLDKSEDGENLVKQSDPVSIMPLSSEADKSLNNQNVADEICSTLVGTNHNTSNSAEIFSPTDMNLIGEEEWIQIEGSESTLFEIYDIFSTYGSISALAKTTDQIYVKFSSWAGIVNVFDNVRTLKQLYQFRSIVKIKENEFKIHLERTEIYLDLPSFVLTYLRDLNELSKALNMVSMTVNDNICLNAPKIQQILDCVRKDISKGFPQCRLFPFGCHILGSSERSGPLEIFVDIGDMYAGCHKQSEEDQIMICKEIRKLLVSDVLWYSHEESPIGIFFHKTVGLKCILNFNNGFGDRCTRLLGVFMDYDERFRVLYLMLDMWSKQCSLQGVTHGLSSYIIAVLLVFYVQVLPLPMLPPLYLIRTSRPVVIKGWDCTFAEDATLLPSNECAMELHSLLRGFFVFYGSFDWKRVVCPSLGQSIDRNVLSSPCAPFPADPAFAKYLGAVSEKIPNTPLFDISSSMCVQDFFNLSENIAKGVSADVLLRFQSLCRQSHKMIYSAESKLPHLVSNFPQRLYRAAHMGRQEKLTTNFNHRTKLCSVSDECTTSSRSGEHSSSSDYPSENYHGMCCVCEKCSFGPGIRGYDIEWNEARHYRYLKGICRRPNYENLDNDSGKSCQTIGNYKARGKKSQECNSKSRSYKGRVFWHHNTKLNSQDNVIKQ